MTRQPHFPDAHRPPSAPAHFSPGTGAVEELEDFINNINSVLESLYIEIKKGATEDDGRPVYALVSARWCPLVVSVRNCGGWRWRWRWRCPRPSSPAVGDTDTAQHGRPALPGSPALLSVSFAAIGDGGAVTSVLTSLSPMEPFAQDRAACVRLGFVC